MFSWIFWGLLLLKSNKPNFTPYEVLFYMGGAAPFLSSVTLTYIAQGKAEAICLVRNTLNFTSLTVKGVFILLVLSTASNVLSVLITKSSETPLISMDLSRGKAIPWFIFLFIVSIIEETGWRGYALPRLLDHYSPLVSSLVLGVVWAIWHIPLFLIPGTWQYSLGFMTVAFTSYMLQLLPRTFIMTWVYIRTGGNPSSAVLFHQFTNMTGELFDVTSRADLMRFLIEIVISIFLGLFS